MWPRPVKPYYFLPSAKRLLSTRRQQALAGWRGVRDTHLPRSSTANGIPHSNEWWEWRLLSVAPPVSIRLQERPCRRKHDSCLDVAFSARPRQVNQVAHGARRWARNRLMICSTYALYQLRCRGDHCSASTRGYGTPSFIHALDVLRSSAPLSWSVDGVVLTAYRHCFCSRRSPAVICRINALLFFTVPREAPTCFSVLTSNDAGVFVR